MINLDRAAKEIKHVGFYDMLFQDVKNILNKKDPSVEEIVALLKERDDVLENYKQLNVEYNISNIHLKDLPVDDLPPECQKEAKRVNENLAVLRQIEKYTLEFEKSSFLVILFSVEFFVLFSVQYFIVLLSLKAYQWYIYGLFALSIVVAWWYAKREKAKFVRENARFQKLYGETMELIGRLEERGCIDYRSLLIEKSDEHV